MKRLIPLGALLPLPALAHPGHVEEQAGHSHWLALAAIGVAAGIAVWQVARKRRARVEEARRARHEPQA